MEAQAAFLRRLLGTLRIEDFYLAGHGFGGAVALTLMRLYPELRPRGLVLSAANLFTDTFVPAPLRTARLPVLGDLVFRAAAGSRMGLALLYLVSTGHKSKASWSRFARHLTPRAVDLTRGIFQRSLADLQGNYQAIEEMLPGLTVPTFLLWGDRDPFFDLAAARRAAAAIPGATLWIYEKTGHFVPEERPPEVAAAIVESFNS
jgi:pimeloyl-ACP methyl ester carboxylesterase